MQTNMDSPRHIANHRLHNQQIAQKKFTTPEELITWMAALQAQDYYASLWAVGLRMETDITEADIEKTLSTGKIVRTWPMRGTLHLVAAEDARWMLNLLTPRVIKSSAGRHRQLELSQTDFTKSRKLLEKVLQGGTSLTRTEIYRVLEENGISTEGQRGYHILWYLAQNAVICFGPRRKKQHTFVLFDEWVTDSKYLKRDEALAELASRYIKSRGPVTEYDFSYWAGLKVSTARKTFHSVETQFEKTEIAGQTFWFPEPGSDKYNGLKKPALLPGFDEIICGYKDRSSILDSEHEKSAILRNGIIRPMIILDKKAVGTWKRTLKKKKVMLEINPFKKISQTDREKIATAGEQYGTFLGLQTGFQLQTT